MSRKLIPVKLTKAQWDLVTEAVFEWGNLCDSEADFNDGTQEPRKAARAKRLRSYSEKITAQVFKSTGQYKKAR